MRKSEKNWWERKTPLKFRVWFKGDEEDKMPRFLKVWEFGTSHSLLPGDRQGKSKKYNLDVKRPNGADCVIQLSTARMDKHGTEAFEGDVIKTNELGWKGVVVWTGLGFVLEDAEGGFSDCSYLDWKRSEVIGNICENPELMQSEEKK